MTGFFIGLLQAILAGATGAVLVLFLIVIILTNPFRTPRRPQAVRPRKPLPSLKGPPS